MKREIMIEIVKKMSSDEEILDFIKIRNRDSDIIEIADCLRFLKHESSVMWVCELLRYNHSICYKAIELLKSEDKAWKLIEKSGFCRLTCSYGVHLIKAERKILKMLKKSNYNDRVCKYAFPLLKSSDEIMQIVRRKEYDIDVCEFALKYIKNISDLSEITKNLKWPEGRPIKESASYKEIEWELASRKSNENKWHRIHEELKSLISNVLNNMTEDQILYALKSTCYDSLTCKIGINILKVREGFNCNRIMKKTMYNDNVCSACI